MKSETEIRNELLQLLEAKEQALRYNKLSALYPDKGPFRRELYPKHVAYMNAGSQFGERAFIAANRTGKTICGAFEMACHLTGKYPSWWQGRKFLNAISAWAAGVSNQATKEIQQFELIGEIDELGTGTIPKDDIIKITKKPGVADAIETVFVRHISGGISKCTFKSYEQGRESFQGTKKQFIWLDEEPKDKNIYTECLTRTMDKYNPGIISCTFTPLFGLSDIVLSFLPDGRYPFGGVNPHNPQKFVTQVSWEEVPHLDDSQKAKILASYSEHEKQARSKGIPSLGSGAIYPHLDEDIIVPHFQIPAWWPRAYGMDVGWNKTAVVWGAMNPDTREIVLYSEYSKGKEQPAVHAAAIKMRGTWIPGVIDPASDGVSQVDGKALFQLYDNEGLVLYKADNSVEAGILKINQMFASGQLKIMDSLKELMIELHIYRRDENGKVIKKNDHLMDAMRYLVMSGVEVMQSLPDEDMNYSSYYTAGSYGRDEITGY